MAAFFLVEETGQQRFPYRIRLVRGDEQLLALRAQEKWPGPGGQVFCLREDANSAADELPEVERVPIAHMRRFGRRLDLVLDRPRRKRCDFLFLKKPYKNRPGEYEQIFFRTQSGIRAHRSRGRPQLFGDSELTVAISVNERYPWKFGAAKVIRIELPAGDYALWRDELPGALVERKTFQNLLADLSRPQILHKQIAELSSYPRSAVVVEAQYGDFLDAKKTEPQAPKRLARLLGEVSVLHPRVPLIFAGNRKMANQWAWGYFVAAERELSESAPEAVAKPLSLFDKRPRKAGLDLRIRRHILMEFPSSFSISHLRERFPDAGDKRLRRVLGGLKKQGAIECRGRGRAARWVRLSEGEE